MNRPATFSPRSHTQTGRSHLCVPVLTTPLSKYLLSSPTPLTSVKHNCEIKNDGLQFAKNQRRNLIEHLECKQSWWTWPRCFGSSAYQSIQGNWKCTRNERTFAKGLDGDKGGRNNKRASYQKHMLHWCWLRRLGYLIDLVDANTGAFHEIFSPQL